MRKALIAGFAVAVAIAAPAYAADAANVSGDIEHLHLDPAARGSLLVGTGQTLPEGEFRISAAMQYGAHAFASYQTSTVPGTLVDDRFTAHFAGAYGVTSWLQVSA